MDQQVSAESASAQYRRGLVRGLSIALALVPFGLLLGALAAQNGLSVAEATLSSAAICAGATQMVGVELFGQNVPAWLILFSLFAVNFRHVLSSASFGRHVRDWTLAQRYFGFLFPTAAQYAE